MTPLRPLPSIAAALLLLSVLPAAQAHHGDPPGPVINCNPDCPTLGEGCPSTPVVDYALCVAADVKGYGLPGWAVAYAVWAAEYAACHVVWSGLC